ncbi:MAG: nucleotide exchange factor GrpE [bacterium]|nr:MAG: nucleotide exchange factor GrpE [bacterium]
MSDSRKKKTAEEGPVPVEVRVEKEGYGGQPPEEPVEELVTLPRQAYDALKGEVADLKDRYLRLAADFDNYRKRVEKEREEIVCYANEKLIADLLPILDNLERALSAALDPGRVGSILEGVRMVANQLHSVLRSCGLEPVEALGSPFDPELHEAVGVLPPGRHEEGTVMAELQKGYRLKGKVLRHSMVQVAGQTAGNSDEGES